MLRPEKVLCWAFTNPLLTELINSFCELNEAGTALDVQKRPKNVLKHYDFK